MFETAPTRCRFRGAIHNFVGLAEPSAGAGACRLKAALHDRAPTIALWPPRRRSDQVLSEAFRVLKPGGRLAVSDVVTRGEVPEAIKRDMLLWVGCIAGALQDSEYKAKLAKAGFEAISIEPTRVYDIEDARAFLTDKGIDVDTLSRRE